MTSINSFMIRTNIFQMLGLFSSFYRLIIHNIASVENQNTFIVQLISFSNFRIVKVFTKDIIKMIDRSSFRWNVMNNN